MNMVRRSKIFGLSAALAVFFCMSGCTEGPDVSESASYSFTANDPSELSPEDAVAMTLAVRWEDEGLHAGGGLSLNGQIAVFLAVGGVPPYTWSVRDASLGAIVETTDASAIYQRKSSGAGENVVILSDSAGNKAYETVSQSEDLTTSKLAVLWEDEGLQGSGLTADGQVAVFSARGGTPPYSWEVSDKGRGSIIEESATSAVYQRKAKEVGDNVIILTDATGNKAYATVSQPTEGTSYDLAIVWENPALQTAGIKLDGQVAVFNASGGTPPYKWRVQDPVLGAIISENIGPSVVYQRNGAGDNVIIVQDKAAKEAFVTILQPLSTP